MRDVHRVANMLECRDVERNIALERGVGLQNADIAGCEPIQPLGIVAVVLLFGTARNHGDLMSSSGLTARQFGNRQSCSALKEGCDVQNVH